MTVVMELPNARIIQVCSGNLVAGVAMNGATILTRPDPTAPRRDLSRSARLRSSSLGMGRTARGITSATLVRAAEMVRRLGLE
jgi:hypothetical protein